MGLGPELCRDPNCDNPTLWTIPAGWTFVGNGFKHTPGFANNLLAPSLLATNLAGQEVSITIKISGRTQGSVRMVTDSTPNPSRSANGTFTDVATLVGASSSFTCLMSADFDGIVSIASIRRVTTMALTSQGWEMTVTLADNGGGLSNLNYQLVAATNADAITAGGTIRAALAAVTGMTMMGYTLTERFVDPVAVLPGDDGVQRENRAKLNCVLDSGLKAETIYIPAPVIGIFEGTSGDAADRVDIADADLIAYLEIWKVTGALATLSDGEYLRDLLPCRSGTRTHRRSSFG